MGILRNPAKCRRMFNRIRQHHEDTLAQHHQKYWNYTAEVIAILLAELCVFVVATQFKVHTMKTALCVLSIYPATILVVWMLETLAGIS